ncbi:MAG: hypothetical protein AB7F23_00415 [Phycisphaerae bacterium]
MKTLSALLALVFAVSGCGGPAVSSGSVRNVRFEGFAPAGIYISPLTKVEAVSGGYNVRMYVELTDSYKSRIKYPGRMRVELFDKKPQSAAGRGERIYMWDELDLTRPSENNKLWRDSLRSYELNLLVPADRVTPGEHITEVSLISNAGIISNSIVLNFGQSEQPAG